jgi:uncharacterized protein (TIGR01244 family)
MSNTIKPILVFSVLSFASGAMAQDVVREEVEGITNFARIETTVACAGAITPDSVSRIRDYGFTTIINLRRPSEEGANIEDEAAAAAAAGVRFVHLPFGGEDLDLGVADQFIEAIQQPGAEPAFVHCAGGGRAATMWYLKRIVVDGWDQQRARDEATLLGMPEEGRLVDYAAEYLEGRAG